MIVTYILQSLVLLGTSYLIYYFLLKRNKNFTFNRHYLLATLMLSLVSPLIQLEVVPTVGEAIESGVAQEQAVVLNTSEILVQKKIVQESIQAFSQEATQSETGLTSVALIVLSIYLLIGILLSFRFTRNLLSIITSAKDKGPKLEGLQIILLKTETLPYSFFNYLFVNKEQFEKNGLSSALLKHELVHSRQKHSIDVLLVELVSVAFWFNPFVWLYKNSISENHEFIADDNVINNGVDQDAYLEEIIASANNTTAPLLVSGFSYLQIKSRFSMMGKSASNKYYGAVRIFGVLALVGALYTLNSCNTKGYSLESDDVAVYNLKMNMLYVGINNAVAITLPGVSNEEITVTSSNGTIVFDAENGNYIANPDTAGKVIVSVFEGAAKDDNMIKEFKFRAQQLKDPIVFIAGTEGGAITVEKLAAAKELIPVLKYSELELEAEVTSYMFTILVDGDLVEIKVDGGAIIDKMTELIERLPIGAKVYFEEIRVAMPDGTKRKASPIIFKIYEEN